MGKPTYDYDGIDKIVMIYRLLGHFIYLRELENKAYCKTDARVICPNLNSTLPKLLSGEGKELRGVVKSPPCMA